MRELKPFDAPAIDLPSREVVSRSNVPVAVVGPVEGLQDEAGAVFAAYRPSRPPPG